MTTDTEKRLVDDLVKQLRALAVDMTYGDDADAAELCRLSAEAIDRLTAERDAAWVGGRDAAAQFIRDTYDIVIDGSNSETELQLLEDLERDIRALSPSTLNKPE